MNNTLKIILLILVIFFINNSLKKKKIKENFNPEFNEKLTT